MGGDRHAELGAELREWWERLWRPRTGSRVVLVAVPTGWGRSAVLERFEADISSRDDAPVTLTVRVNGEDLRGATIGVQAEKLRACLAEAAHRPWVVEILGLDELSGQAQLGLAVGSLAFVGLTAGVSFLLVGLAVGAAGKAWDATPAGQDGALARAARAVAAVSVSAPVVVIIDDADCLDHGLAVTLVENLTARLDAQVLIIAAVDPGSALTRAVRSQVRYGVTGELVHAAKADPDMGYQSRLELARQLCPELPDAAARRIAQRTTTFAEVFTVAGAPRLAELGRERDQAAVVAVVDAAVNARLTRPAPSLEAAVIAWAGGLAHVRQVDRALGILGATRTEDDPDVRRWESLERLADPALAAPRLADQVAADLAERDRLAMAGAFLDVALALTQAPGAGLIDQVAAVRAALHVRVDLPEDLSARGELARARSALAAALEALGDHAAALQAATEAQAGWPVGGEHQDERDTLDARVIRLTLMASQASPGPLADQLIAEAAAGGAAAGLEARIWSAVILLDTPGRRAAALALAETLTADLEARGDLGAYGDQWRLLLAYHVGRAGLTDLTTQLLAPLITSADPERQKRARVVRRAVDRPGADIRLQNILLNAELDTLSPGADDDRLRVHHALAENYAALGKHRQALTHGQHELDLRTRIQGTGRPATLTTRGNIARWTGQSGDPARALRLYQDLLPDMDQGLGPRHPGTLITRGEMAHWTGESGDPAGALQLARNLLPDVDQGLGLLHPITLSVRSNIATWTGQCGDAAEALRLYRDLLPDVKQVLGPLHQSALTIRGNIAAWTAQCGDAAEALRLYQDLLTDEKQILGLLHPSTLEIRTNIATLTGRCGNPAAALQLARDLLPDEEQVLGARHPNTLLTRSNIAAFTGRCGDAAGALRLYEELLPSQEQVLGPRHPATLIIRGTMAVLTNQCGDSNGALQLARDLLRDEEQVHGPRHPATLAVRALIARWIGESGDGR
jgi:tetratricopeptide (TPR) repeat protein